MIKKRMVFHIPKPVSLHNKSGSQIRPPRMIKAFKNIGYKIDIISGFAEDRKEKIELIKNKIDKGIKYDFIYSESSTMPTLLSARKNKFTLNFNIDFYFLKHCKNRKIPIGLFYRDIHWRFDEYKKHVNTFKRYIREFFYFYDLLQYKRLVDVLFLPSKSMFEYIPFKFDKKIMGLPPGMISNNLSKVNNNRTKKRFTIFYVGGIGDIYQMHKLFEFASKNEKVQLIVCTRKKEWEKVKNEYINFLNDNIRIIHKSGNELLPYYAKADIASIFLKPIEYHKFAMPTKLFEYLSYGLPIISSKNTAFGKFIEENNVGWSVNYNKSKLEDIFDTIFKNPNLLQKKKENIKQIKKDNTWKSRAKNVVKSLNDL